MKLSHTKIIGLSLCTAIALQVNLSANEQKKTESLGSVDVVSTTVTEQSGSYTTDYVNTATRINLLLKETPQSINVVTNQQIKDMGLEDLNDVINTVTGLSSKTNDSERQSYSARGFDITTYQIDGIPSELGVQWNTGEVHTDLTIYDRVEVVRGATGLISGAGDPSAAINLVRKHADSKELTGNLSLQAGTWSKYRGDLDISSPLNEDGSIRGRFSASYEDKESYLDLYSRNKTVLYGVIDADLSDETKVSTGISNQKTNANGVTWGGLPGRFSDGTETNWDRSKTTAADWSEFNFDNTSYFANIEHYFKNNIKLYAAYSRTDNSSESKLLYLYGTPDITTGLGMGGGAGKYDVERKQDNLDIYTSIPFELGGLDHEILAGLMYNKSDFKAYSYGYIGGTVGNFYEWDGSYTEPTWNAKSLSVGSKTEQLGSYLVGRFSLSEQVKLILGSRFTKWKTSGTSYGSAFSIEHDNIVTPYAGLIYNVNEDLSAYASYSNIFKPQDALDSNGNYLDPIEGNSYEIGLKSEFFDDRLNASVAIFKIEQDNLAQTDPSGAFVPGTSTIASIAAEGVTSKGFEVDVNGEINENWNVSLGYSQFKAQDASGTDVNTDHPRKTFKFFTKYNMDKLSLGGGVNWQNALITTSNTVSQDAYFLVNIMAKYKLTKNLSTQINVNNLLDETYYTNTSFYGASYGEPRNITLSLKYSF